MLTREKNQDAVRLGKLRAEKAGRAELSRLGKLGMLSRWGRREKPKEKEKEDDIPLDTG